MATIGKIKISDTTYDIAGSISYIKPTVKSAGSSNSGAYAAAKWAVDNINGSTTLTEGMTIAVRTPGAGTKGGVLLSIDGGATYKPLARNVNTIITTHYAANSTLILTYNSTAAVAGVYATSNTSSTITGCWQIADYDSNSTYSNASLGGGYGTCSTAEATLAKVVDLTGSYSLSEGGIVTVKFTNAVPANATLNVDSKGAKAILYKGAAIPANIIKAGDIATFMYTVISSKGYYILLSRDSLVTESHLTESDVQQMIDNSFASRTYDGALMSLAPYSFQVDDKEYFGQEGMTWYEWINSEHYATDSLAFTCSSSTAAVFKGSTNVYSGPSNVTGASTVLILGDTLLNAYPEYHTK